MDVGSSVEDFRVMVICGQSLLLLMDLSKMVRKPGELLMMEEVYLFFRLLIIARGLVAASSSSVGSMILTSHVAGE